MRDADLTFRREAKAQGGFDIMRKCALMDVVDLSHRYLIKQKDGDGVERVRVAA